MFIQRKYEYIQRSNEDDRLQQMHDLAFQAVELDEYDVKAKMHLGVTLVEQGKR